MTSSPERFGKRRDRWRIRRDLDAIWRTEEENRQRFWDSLRRKHKKVIFSFTYAFLKMIFLINFKLKFFKDDLLMWCWRASILLKLYYVIFISFYKFHIIERHIVSTIFDVSIYIFYIPLIRVVIPEICSICGEWKLLNRIQWGFTVDEERGCSISVFLKIYPTKSWLRQF